MAEVPMQYSPELSQAVLDNMLKDIERRRAQAAAQAQGAAVTRGIAGSGWEGKQIGLANMSAQDAATQAALDIAIKNADYANRIKEIQMGQTFQAEEAGKQRSFLTSERLGTQDYMSAQEKLRQQFEREQALTAYERTKSEGKRNRRWGTVTAGLSAMGGAVGQYAGSFGAPAAA